MAAEGNSRFGIEGFGFKPPKLPPETAARWAVEKHRKFLGTASNLELLLVPIGKKKPSTILRFLYGNANATLADLWKLTEDEPPAIDANATLADLWEIPEDETLGIDAVRKTIDRLNKVLREAAIPLKIVKERSNTHTLGQCRVWLDVCG